MWSSDVGKIYDEKGQKLATCFTPPLSIFCQKFGEKGDFEAPLMCLCGQYFIGNKLLEDAEKKPGGRKANLIWRDK